MGGRTGRGGKGWESEEWSLKYFSGLLHNSIMTYAMHVTKKTPEQPSKWCWVVLDICVDLAFWVASVVMEGTHCPFLPSLLSPASFPSSSLLNCNGRCGPSNGCSCVECQERGIIQTRTLSFTS
jgi:hypothetical protein